VSGLSVTGPAECNGAVLGEEVPEISFAAPLPGFPGLTKYVLVRMGGVEDGEDTVLYELRSLEHPEVRFLVGVPTAFFPEYSFDLDELTCFDLDLRAAEETLVLVLLTIGDDSASTTANLLAPVVINARTRSAAQVILSGTDWPVRAAVA
jgi:flagellar assembly factor FliW